MVPDLKPPLVSIISPFLNVEKFLEESIGSVLNQTYGYWELMLIDDGSTDNSTKIAKKYAEEYFGKIIYLEHENHQNLGASASRNLGIKKSRGEYIAFLDADDIYLPKKLEEQVNILKSHPTAGMLYASTEYWHSWTGRPEDNQKDWIWDNFGVMPETLVFPPNLLTMFLRDGGTVPCMGSILVRREAINAVDGWEKVFTYLYDDQVFHAKISLNWPVFVCKGVWDKYRQYPLSSSREIAKNLDEFEARYLYLTWLKKYILEQKANNNLGLWKALQNARKPYKYYLLKKVFKRTKTIIKKIKINVTTIMFG